MSIYPEGTQTAKAIEYLVAQLLVTDAFGAVCNHNEYTDTGDAWDHINRLRDSVREALKVLLTPEQLKRLSAQRRNIKRAAVTEHGLEEGVVIAPYLTKVLEGK